MLKTYCQSLLELVRLHQGASDGELCKRLFSTGMYDSGMYLTYRLCRNYLYRHGYIDRDRTRSGRWWPTEYGYPFVEFDGRVCTLEGRVYDAAVKRRDGCSYGRYNFA